MVASRGFGVNDGGGPGNQGRAGVGGWLLLLCLLLLVVQPIRRALIAAGSLPAVEIRGLPLAVVVLGQLVVAGIGGGAAVALLGRRVGAATFAKWSLALSAGMDLFVYVTPFAPSNRYPGTTPFYIAASLAYHAIWIAYLFRSKRVRNTFGERVQASGSWLRPPG